MADRSLGGAPLSGFLASVAAGAQGDQVRGMVGAALTTRYDVVGGEEVARAAVSAGSVACDDES